MDAGSGDARAPLKYSAIPYRFRLQLIRRGEGIWRYIDVLLLFTAYTEREGKEADRTGLDP